MLHKPWKIGGGTLLLAMYAGAVAGYHPYAEDGGVYVAGVKKLLRPALYPAWTQFVTEHLRFSLFAPAVAGLVRVTHAPLEWVLLALYLLSLWAMLLAGWMLAARCVASERGRWGAVTLLSCWMTLPIAGTAQALMDPCVTARSISTPLVLAAIAWAADARRRSLWLCGAALLGAALVHPLMAAYGLAMVLAIRLERQKWGFVAGGLSLAALVQWKAPPESADYLRAVLTRGYWFPAHWAWYEWLGLAGPMLVLPALSQRGGIQARRLIRAAVLFAGLACAVALLFSRLGLATHMVARLQPLRSFGVVYQVMTLLLGAWMGERVLRGSRWRWAVLLVGMGGVLFAAERQVYASSAHIEWPGRTPVNAWERGFVWVRDHTPENAVVALDAHYITEGRGEDAQCFRAIAERSSPADYSKDGGETSITPSLAEAWIRGQQAQTGLGAASDDVRFQRLHDVGAGWVVLERQNVTAWVCPYSNERVKVCRVP